MDSRPPESVPYRNSGHSAACRLAVKVRREHFVDILAPGALTARAAEVMARGRSNARFGLAACVMLAALAVVLGVRAAQVFDGTIDNLVVSNFYMLGAVVALGLGYVTLMMFSGGRRLQATARKLQDRANLRVRIDEGPR